MGSKKTFPVRDGECLDMRDCQGSDKYLVSHTLLLLCAYCCGSAPIMVGYIRIKMECATIESKVKFYLSYNNCVPVVCSSDLLLKNK